MRATIRVLCIFVYRLRLVVSQATADIDRLRGHRRGGVGNQIADEGSDFAGSGIAAERYFRLEALEDGLLGRVVMRGVALPDPLSHRGFDVARADGVNGDARLRELEPERLSESDDAVLRCGVRGAEHHALLAAGRGDVDDASPAPLNQLARLEHLAGDQEDAV